VAMPAKETLLSWKEAKSNRRSSSSSPQSTSLRRLLVFFAIGDFTSDREGSVGGVKVSDLGDSGWDSDDRSLQVFRVFVHSGGGSTASSLMVQLGQLLTLEPRGCRTR
jgi:hypothetical protein